MGVTRRFIDLCMTVGKKLKKKMNLRIQKLLINSLSKGEVFRIGASNVVSMSLIETQIDKWRHQATAEHNWICSTYQTQSPKHDGSRHERQRNISKEELNELETWLCWWSSPVCEVSKRRSCNQKIRHNRHNCYTQTSKKANQTVNLYIKQDFCVLGYRIKS